MCLLVNCLFLPSRIMIIMIKILLKIIFSPGISWVHAWSFCLLGKLGHSSHSSAPCVQCCCLCLLDVTLSHPPALTSPLLLSVHYTSIQFYSRVWDLQGLCHSPAHPKSFSEGVHYDRHSQREIPCDRGSSQQPQFST